MDSFSVFLLALVLLPAVAAAVWTWLEIIRTAQGLDSLDNFEGMHFEEREHADR